MHLPSINVLVQVVVIGLLTGGVYALMAGGLTLIFGVMKVINIAHGAFLILSAYIAYLLFTNYGVDPVLSVIVSVPLFLLIGAFMQNRMLNRIHSEPGLTVLLTFAMALFLQGGMGALFGTTGRSIRTPYTSIVIPVDIFGITVRLPLVRLVGFILALVALTVLTLLLLYTDQGRGTAVRRCWWGSAWIASRPSRLAWGWRRWLRVGLYSASSGHLPPSAAMSGSRKCCPSSYWGAWAACRGPLSLP